MSGEMTPQSGAFANGDKFGGKLNPFADSSYYQGAQNTLQSKMIDPLITGYSFIYWTKIPDWVATPFGSQAEIKALLQKNFKGLSGLDSITLATGTTTAGFTPNETAWATSIQKNQGFSTNHQEYSGSPMRLVFERWVTGIRDPETGVALYPAWEGAHNGQYGARHHTGEALYVMMRPDAFNDKAAGSNIEFACYFTNVFPTVIPMDHLNYAGGTNDLVEFEQPWMGTRHTGPAIMELAKELVGKQSENFEFVFEGDWKPEAAQA